MTINIKTFKLYIFRERLSSNLWNFLCEKLHNKLTEKLWITNKNKQRKRRNFTSVIVAIEIVLWTAKQKSVDYLVRLYFSTTWHKVRDEKIFYSENVDDWSWFLLRSGKGESSKAIHSFKHSLPPQISRKDRRMNSIKDN